MPTVLWHDSLAIGVKEIDQHHRHLVGLLNTAFHALESGEYRQSFPGILEELQNYAHYHFGFEEQGMQRYRYPDYLSHKEEHDRFAARVVDLRQEYEGRTVDKALFMETISFLTHWLVHHIQKTDADFGNYLRRLRAQQAARGAAPR